MTELSTHALTRSAQSMRSTRLWLAVLIALAVLVHGRNVAHDFVDWDDNAMVVKLKYLNPVSLQHLGQVWSGPVEGLYTPMAYTVWSALALVARLQTPDVHGSTLNPMPFHMLNVALHLICVAIVFDLLVRLLGVLRGRDDSEATRRSVLPAFIGAAVFAVHPLEVEPIAWIAGMNNVLAGAFSLGCIWAYVRYALLDAGSVAGELANENRPAADVPAGEKRKPSPAERLAERLYIGATVLLVLAYCSKPTAIVTPLVLFAIDTLILRRPIQKCLAGIVPLVLLSLPFIWIGHLAQPARDTFRPPMAHRLIVAGDALGFYLQKLIAPLPLLIDYSRRPEVVLATGGAIGHWVAAFLAIAVTAYTWRRARWVAGGMAVFVAGLALVLGIIPFDFQQYSTVADRYAYLSMLGVAIVVCGSVAHALNSRRAWLGKGVLVLSAVAILSFSWVSFRQGAYWADTETLSEHTVSNNPGSMAALTMLGFLAEHRGDLEAAKYYNRLGLQHFPNDGMFNRNYGNLIRAENPAEAITHYRTAFEHGDREPELLNNWGAALQDTGHIAEAIEAYNVALADKPDHVTSLVNLGHAYLLLQKPEEAEKPLRHALQVDPKSQLAAQYLAQAEAMKKH